MDRHTAREIAAMLDGEACQLENEAWIVVMERADGRVVVLSETSVEEYPDRASVATGHCYACISLT
jgi:hypothetical protein